LVAAVLRHRRAPRQRRAHLKQIRTLPAVRVTLAGRDYWRAAIESKSLGRFSSQGRWPHPF